MAPEYNGGIMPGIMGIMGPCLCSHCTELLVRHWTQSRLRPRHSAQATTSIPSQPPPGSVSTNGRPALVGDAWPRRPLIGREPGCEAVTLSVLLWRHWQCRDWGDQDAEPGHTAGTGHWEESLKSDLQTITKVPHYVLFRAIHQFIAYFLIPFKVWMTRLHLMHSGILSRARVTPHAHIWSGRDLDMGCTFGHIRRTPLWRREFKHFHSPQVELYFSRVFQYAVHILSIKDSQFPHCAPDCRAENWICRQSLLQLQCCRVHIIGYWSPQSIINWEL